MVKYKVDETTSKYYNQTTMANLYTMEQLSEANLPGFHTPAALSEVLAPQTDWQTVLSLSMLTQGDNGLMIQTGIRREDTNFTHPGVVSTPTGRVPRRLAHQLLRDKYENRVQGDSLVHLAEVNPQRPQVIASLSGNAEPLPNSEAVLPFLASALMASKLGCAQVLEQATTENPLGTVSLSTIMAGFSYASDEQASGEPLFEPLIMLGAVADIKDPGILSQTTEAYRQVSWVDLDEFRKGFATRRANILIPNITPEEEVKVCVRGLCLATSGAAISDETSLTAHIQQ